MSANASGDMKLSVETDMVAISTHFQNLSNPTWSEYSVFYAIHFSFEQGINYQRPLICYLRCKSKKQRLVNENQEASNHKVCRGGSANVIGTLIKLLQANVSIRVFINGQKSQQNKDIDDHTNNIT